MRPSGERAARGFTLVELLLALGLLAILLLALVRMLDTSLTIWARTESERDLLDLGGAVLDLMAADVHAVEGGPRGDLVAQWQRFDTDGDDVPSLLWPRLTLVRQVNAAEWRRLAQTGASRDARHGGLVEVCWALLPDRSDDTEQRGVGVLWRGERRLDGAGTSLFDARFFDAAGRPLPGALEPLTGGVLWFEPRFATQTSILVSALDGETRSGPGRGWPLGEKLADCASSWDAFGRGRPDEGLSFLNEPGAGMPEAGELPSLPRRVRVTLEIERPADRKRRTRLALELAQASQEMVVRDVTRLPAEGELVLVGDEWIELGLRARGSVAILRGRRGTRPERHEVGTLVHHGRRLERELVVPAVREDWDL